ncbi:hypothetical protein BRC81_11425 [Halobacteriales archaeon QS_1_68_20]|nr:MAG: hypothetical protein BRC81_11425 [Halobacteriales archaeon QS_1_68_20]
MRIPTVLRKTVGDLSNPKVLLAYFVLYLGVLTFFAIGFGSEISEQTASLPPSEHGTAMLGAFLPVVYIWGSGLAVLSLGAVFGALTLAAEAEAGTLRILLSKPVRRWQVLAGTLGGVVGYLTLVAVTSTLLAAVALYEASGVGAAALEDGVFDVLPGLIVYALFASAFVGSISVSLSVFTRDRLRTAIAGLLVPAVFFVCWVAKLIVPARYEDYSLYFVDVGYHLGNGLVLILEATRGDLPVEAQQSLGLFAGVYEQPAPDAETTPESLELVAYVEPVTSLAALSLFVIALLAVATVRFQRMDV